MMAAKKISKRTIKSLRTVASKYFPKGDEYDRENSPYHVWLGATFGVSSTLDLTDEQGLEARKMIDAMLKEQRANSRSGNSLRMTDAQFEYMCALFSELDIPAGPRQIGFVKKQIGVSKSPSWLNPKEARKVITGLERYKKSVAKELDKRLNPNSDAIIDNQ